MSNIKYERKWAMPNINTFTIKPIEEFVKRNLTGITVDPFARNNNYFTYTNDLSPDTNAMYHMDAEEFILKLHLENIKADVVIFDPPYSPRQISECYRNIGKKVTGKDTQNASLYKRVKDAINLITKPNSIVLSFGWNSNGMGIKRGYEIQEILLVAHGGGHNDTICIKEIKNNNNYNLFENI